MPKRKRNAFGFVKVSFGSYKALLIVPWIVISEEPIYLHEWGTTNPHVYYLLFFAALYGESALGAPINVRKR